MKSARPADSWAGCSRSTHCESAWLALPTRQYPSKSEYVYREGCLFPTYIRYVIRKDGQYQLARSEEDLLRLYAPIENGQEALSYALAVSGLEARYGLQYEPGLRYFVDELQGHLRPTESNRVTWSIYLITNCAVAARIPPMPWMCWSLRTDKLKKSGGLSCSVTRRQTDLCID